MSGNSTISRCIRRAVSVFAAISLVLSSSVLRTENTAYAESDMTELYKEYVNDIVVLVNEARMAEGIAPLYAVPVLCEISQIRAEEISEYFSHNRPDGSEFYSILDEYRIFFGAAAENNAAGGSTPEAAFQQWRNSPGHWSAIMNPQYTHIGVGVCYAEGSVYGWYWEQMFIANDKGFDNQYLPEKDEVVPVSYGDVDGDGAVTSFDLTLLKKKVNKEVDFNEKQLESADCMRDGVITSADVSVLKKYLFGVYGELPVYP
ncbi:MAG: SCP-like extracellular [Ruminococcus sp.]|nr:SCP-like extracellular [Ruminococcus sp.]